MGNKPPLNALTGIRFVAAAVVFIHHLGGKFGFERNGYCIGSMAVTFFFVLSGFILTYAYHDRFSKPMSRRKYFVFTFRSHLATSFCLPDNFHRVDVQLERVWAIYHMVKTGRQCLAFTKLGSIRQLD